MHPPDLPRHFVSGQAGDAGVSAKIHNSRNQLRNINKILVFCILLLLTVSPAFGVVFEDKIEINSDNTFVSDDGKVKVFIRTYKFESQEQKSSKYYQSLCPKILAYCTAVETLQIYVNNKEIIVPFSVYATLFNLHHIKIVKDQTQYYLLFLAADGSEGYRPKIEFDKERVLSTSILINADYLSRHTKYYPILVYE